MKTGGGDLEVIITFKKVQTQGPVNVQSLHANREGINIQKLESHLFPRAKEMSLMAVINMRLM